MKAIVLAGGFGSRLKPLTDRCPKPLLKIAGIPMLDYTVAQLAAYGIDEVTYTLSYRAGDIMSFCGGYALPQAYVIERAPLGTCGGVKAASGGAGPVFLVMSGDALNDIDLSALLLTHYRTEALVTMAVTETENPSLYGVVQADGDGIVRGFVEKPDTDAFGRLVNCGVYVVDRRALRYVPDNAFFDFSRDLFPVLLEKGRLAAYRHTGYWTDIGDVKSYYKANFDMAAGGLFARLPNRRAVPLKPFVEGDSTSYAAETARIEGFAFRSILNDGAVIASDAAVSDCVVLDGATVHGIHTGEVIGRDFRTPIGAFPELCRKNGNFYQNFLKNSSN